MKEGKITMLDAQTPILVYWVSCHCGERILLPRQCPLGTFEDQEYQATDKWPADFLCLRCGLGFSGLLRHPGMVPALSIKDIYLAELPYRDARDNYATQKALYIGVNPASAPVDALQQARDFLKLSFGVVETEVPIAHLW